MALLTGLEKAPSTDIVVYGPTTRGTKAIGTLAIPVRDHINASTATSLMHNDWSFLGPKQNIDRLIIQGNILTLQRNEAVQRMRGDWLMFIDDDMVWEPQDIGRLIAARDEIDADIMGALCYRRSAPHQPTMFMREHPTSGGYNYLEDWEDGIVEVDGTGMAFVIIHKRVFERIADSPMPSYDTRRMMGPSGFFRWEGVLGEDLRFCQDAKEVDCRIFVDTRIEVGHMSEIEIRRKHYLIESLYRSQELMDVRGAKNDEMGLPTLTKEKARERLGWS
jgi:glycosyltransferase involved in cell wall biosynthesis